MSKKITTESKTISFHFQPNGFDEGAHAVTKADFYGNKRRYLRGISSGLNVDAHGEKMSEKCIKSFMDQANSGDILLYADVHGIRESEDIGRLEKCCILPNGDWDTEYRLYDQYDQVGQYKLEKADTIWQQINGLPPYKSKKQKGFSVEGILDENSVVTNSMGQIDRSVLDNVLLDGVVIVPRPAYRDSVATAIYKALGETSPERKESIKTVLRDKIEQQDINEKYYKLKWDYNDALENVIDGIMKKKNNNKKEELGIAFGEYQDLMIELIMQSQQLFADEPTLDGAIEAYGEASLFKGVENPKLLLYKSLLSGLKDLSKIMEDKHNV